jgi:inosine-uridine nucleoside N-ribohydrolase
MQRIHLDTDLGSDTDDLCALAMLLGWPDVELTGITTVSDSQGLRVGFLDYVLRLVDRQDIPVAAGADGSLSGFRGPVSFPFDSSDGHRYWPEPITPRPSPPGAVLDLLARSIAAGATLVAIGPYTNLALLETARPGSLASTEVVLMGGYITPPRPGLPDWGPAGDYNVQQDTLAAQLVFERGNPLLVQLPICLDVTLRTSHLPRLRSMGPLGELLAAQSELHGADSRVAELARQHEALPADLLNWQYDPLTCAVAAGWDGVTTEEIPLVAATQEGVLSFALDPAGKPTRVVTGVDAGRFEEEWLAAVARAARGAARS